MNSIWRSTPLKIAVAFSVAITVITYAIFAVVSWQVSGADIARIRTILEYESERASMLPLEESESELGLRLTHDLRRLDFVGVFKPDGTYMSGNVPSSTIVPVDGRAHLVQLSTKAAQGSEPTIVIARRRPDGNIVVLGRSLIEIYHLRVLVQEAFAAAILPTALIALLTGVLVSRAGLRRLAAIKGAIDRVIQGELQVRLPHQKTSGDINELAGAVNSMLDEFVRLINQIKSVGDNIAHDLRTPLAVMRARLERALEADCHHGLVAATQGAMADLDRALTTANALLRISELENGLQRRAFARVDLVEICSDVFELYEAVGSAKRLTMTFDRPAACMIFGDGDLLREAVANLMDNAIKFTPPGGAVTLTCKSADALVKVSDTGPGVSAVERDKIFERFYRATATQSEPGFGLGLSMASTIVALHGYALQIGDNHPGAVFAMVPVTNDG